VRKITTVTKNLKKEKPDLDIDEQRKIARDWIANQKGRS
jgi:hypothetical protein